MRRSHRRTPSTFLLSALVLAAVLSSAPRPAAGQSLAVLRITIVLIDAERKPTPVARHGLLVSDNPPSAAPRRIVTALDGTAEVRLRPGSYTVESERPVAFESRAYQWTQMVDVVAGRDAVLELTAGNAEVHAVSAAATTSDRSSLTTQWQDSVVSIWTPTTHASGFVVGPNGLVATSQRSIGTATTVEVQLTASVKVAGNVLVADPVRDVALLRIDPKVAASVRSVPLGCAGAAKSALVNGQEIFAIGASLRQQKGTASGTVSRVEAHAIVSDLILSAGSPGGPVFTAGGGIVGLTSIGDEGDARQRADARVVRIDDLCDVVASAEERMRTAPPPDGTPLPVEPPRPFPVSALEDAAERRAGSLSAYRMSSPDFDIAFITPVMIYGAEYQSEQAGGRGASGQSRTVREPAIVSPVLDFANWAEYVADFPPVLLIRVTPKLVEGFWAKVARGAAQTQGVSLPPVKRFKSGFSRMQAFCGDVAVPPIHPFKLERRVSESDAVYEGLYAFPAGAIGPECGSVKLVLYSEKELEKGDTLVVDMKVLDQIWQDFAPYRALR